MTVPLRFGYKASAEQFGPAELLDYAIQAEEAGFDSVFISDHLQPWLHDGGHAPASVPWLGALGAKTSRVLIGTSVLTPTFRYNPTVVAQDFATLGVMYPGRVILGVGTGEALNEANLGITWPDPPERFQRLKEAIGLIRRLWSEDRVNFDGTYYTARNITIYDKLPEPVPIYIGAAGPAATRLAGRIADGLTGTTTTQRGDGDSPGSAPDGLEEVELSGGVADSEELRRRRPNSGVTRTSRAGAAGSLRRTSAGRRPGRGPGRGRRGGGSRGRCTSRCARRARRGRPTR